LSRSDARENGTVRLYGRLVVGFARKLESRLRPPVGKNIMLIAQGWIYRREPCS
jgi:hypothetical protein